MAGHDLWGNYEQLLQIKATTTDLLKKTFVDAVVDELHVRYVSLCVDQHGDDECCFQEWLGSKETLNAVKFNYEDELWDCLCAITDGSLTSTPEWFVALFGEAVETQYPTGTAASLVVRAGTPEDVEDFELDSPPLLVFGYDALYRFGIF